MPRIEAVIFDMDGVLVDSEPVHRLASRQLVAPHEMTDEDYEQFIGSTGTAFMTWMHTHYDLDGTVEEISARYSATIVEELTAHPLQPLDGVVDLIATLS